MIKTSCDFKVGTLTKLKNQSFEIKQDAKTICFNILGIDVNNNSYSIGFSTTILLDEMLKFELNKIIDFTEFIDMYDVTFGINGVYTLDAEIKMEIIRYLDTSFILNIMINHQNMVIGCLELTFSIE